MESIKDPNKTIIEETPTQQSGVVDPAQQDYIDTMVGWVSERHGMQFSPQGLDYYDALKFSSDMANQAMSQRVNTLQNMVVQGEITAEELLTFDLDKRTNALEDEASAAVIEDIQLTQDPSDQEIVGSEPEEVALYTSGRLESLEIELNKAYERQGFLKKTFDIGTQLFASETEVILNNLKPAFNVPGVTPAEILRNISFYIRMAPDKNTAEERISLLRDTLSDADLIENVDVSRAIISKIKFYPWDSQNIDNAFFALDAMGLTGGVAQATAAASARLGKLSTRAVSSRQKSLIAQGAGAEEEARKGVVSHGGLPEDVGEVPINGADGKALEDTVLPTVTDQELVEAAERVTVSEFREELKGSQFFAAYNVDWNNIPVNLERGGHGQATVNVYLGSGIQMKDGFISEVGARAAASQYPGAEAVLGDGGKYWVKISKDINPYEAHTVEVSQLRPKGALSTNLLNNIGSADFLSDDVVGNGFRHLAFDARRKLQSDVDELYEPILAWNRKNSKESVNLDHIMRSGAMAKSRRGDSRGIWWTKEEFSNKWTSDPAKLEEAWGVYQEFRRIDDIMYTKTNESLRSGLIRQGYSQINSQDIDSFVGRQVTRDIPAKVYDPKKRTMVDSEGYTVFRTRENGRELFVGLKNYTSTALPQYVLNKTEGGRRMYGDNQWFVRAITPEGRQNIAIAAGADKAEGEAFINAVNTALKSMKQVDELGQDAVNAAIEEATAGILDMNLGSFAKFADEAGLLNKDGTARELTITYEGATGARQTDLDILEEIDSVGSMYTSSRTGRNLKGFKGGEAPIMDPLAAQYSALQRTLRLMTTDEYLARVHRTFRTNARGLLDSSANGMSDAQVFANPVWRKGLSPDEQMMVNRLEAMKVATDRSFRQVTNWDQGLNDLARGTIMEKWTNRITSSNPIDVVRGLTFDMYLGMFSIRQAWLQSSAVLNTIMVTPRSGFKASTLMPTVRMALAKPEAVDQIAKMVDKTTKNIPGVDHITVDDFKSLVDDVRKSGKTIIGRGAAELGTEDAGRVLSDTKKGWLWPVNSIRNGGRFFFNEGEKLNRLVAYIAARDEHLKQGKKLSGPKDYAEVSDRAEVLTMRMTTASKAAWNEGIMSIPTQFWNYQVRWFESIVGNRISLGEKTRLLAGTLGLYGTAGTIGGVPALHALGLLDEDVTPDTRRTAHFGLLSTFVDSAYEMAGMDSPNINYSELGPQLATNTLIEALYDLANGVDDTSMVETLFGAAASSLSRVYEVTGNLMNSIYNFDPEDWTGSTFSVLGNLASYAKSGEDYVSAYYIYRYGVDANFRQGLKDQGVDSEQALYRALGLKTTEQSTVFTLSKLKKYEDAVYRDLVNDTVLIHRKYTGTQEFSLEQYREALLNNYRLVPPRFSNRFLRDVDRGLDGTGRNIRDALLFTLQSETDLEGLITDE